MKVVHLLLTELTIYPYARPQLCHYFYVFLILGNNFNLILKTLLFCILKCSFLKEIKQFRKAEIFKC